MPKLRSAKHQEVIRILEKQGFNFIRQSGSHADGRWTTIPIHKGKDIGKGLLHKILKDIELDVEEFEKLS